MIFELDGVEYNLYYTRHKDTKEVKYIYVESNSEDSISVEYYYKYLYIPY